MDETPLVTREEFDKAVRLILRHLDENGPSGKADLGRYQLWGISRTAIDLAIASLTHEGTVTQLYTLSRPQQGNKRTFYMLSTYDGELPDGTCRIEEALTRISL